LLVGRLVTDIYIEDARITGVVIGHTINRYKIG